MKVLVTIGSMVEKKFTRIFKTVDELCEEGILDGKNVIAQVGFDNYSSKYYKCFDMIADEDFKRIIGESDLIIAHAGTGTVISSIKQGKKVIIFPRMAQYDEHYDDHQLELAELFTKQGYVLQARNKDELKNCILNLDGFTPVPFVSNNANMNKLVIDFIERDNMSKTSVAVVMTVFNRIEKTSKCIDSLLAENTNDEFHFSFYITNDGSTDNTSEVLAQYQARFPEVSFSILNGSGNLFWNKGMFLAYGKALKSNVDYYLWVNNDVVFRKGFLEKIINDAKVAKEQSKLIMICGSVSKMGSNEWSYGGVKNLSNVNPYKRQIVIPSCTYFRS